MDSNQNLYLKNMTVEEADTVVKKIVPHNSPQSRQIRSFIFDLISLSPNYLLNIESLVQRTELTTLSDDDCKTIINTVKSNKQSDAWAVSYMLAQFTIHYREKACTDACWQFMSKYLQLMLLIAERDDRHYKKISKLGVRVRMALDKDSSQEAILESLFKIHVSSNDAYKNFTDIDEYEKSKRHEEETGQAKTKSIAKKIGEIRLAYEVVIKNKNFIERKRNEDEQGRASKSSSNKREVRHTDEPTRQIRFANKHTEDNVATPENLADDDPPILLDNDYAPSKTTAKSSQLQQFQVKTNYLHSKRNQFFFPGNTRLLPVPSYQLLFTKLWDLISEGALLERQVAAVLLLSLLTGRQINTIIAEVNTNKGQRHFLIKKDSGETVIENGINVTLNRRSKIKPHIKSNSNSVRLSLPPRLQAILQYNFEVEKAAVDALLKSLKNDLALPLLSNQHIESGLAFLITHMLDEPLHANIITGVEVEHSSPLYYTSIETSSLLNTYQAAIKVLSDKCFKNLKGVCFYKVKNAQVLTHRLDPKNHQLWQTHKDPFFVNMPIVSSNINKKYIGSEMALTDEGCSKFFKALSNNLHKYNGRLIRDAKNNRDTYIDQFNAYSLWLWHLIQIQTGIRPVNDAPGFLHQFNFTHDIYWVSDKSIRQGKDDGRLIPISNFLKTALNSYLDYLQQFAILHNPIYPDHALPIKKILQSKVPLLQMFSFNPKGFIAISPGRIRSVLGKFLYHQDNWLRHQLRSMLTNKVDEFYIRALFGHEQADQEMFHPISSSSINQYKTKLVTHLDNVAKQLQLTQVEVSLYG